jgi:hypothetical protein
MAPNLATTQILADPAGTLAELQQRVAAAFAEPRWIRARCDAEKAMSREQLEAMRTAATPAEGFDWLWMLLNSLSGLLAVSMLRRPTTRRTLSLLSELLVELGRPELKEAALSLWGSGAMSRAEVEAILAQSSTAFDRAVEVYRTPIPIGFMLQAHLRPYLVQGSQEMIEQGQHREAMYWIMAMGGDAYRALLNDAPADEKPEFAAQLRALHTALGYTSPEGWAGRVADAERLTRDIFALADELVAARG